MEEALVPGASVAEVARRHDMNTNLLFKWLRSSGLGRGQARKAPQVEPGVEFVPLGTFMSVLPEAPASPLVEEPSSRPERRAQSAAPKLEERAGVIEIDLPEGARVRVDAFVNQGALRRVLQALRG
jgi:transposase